MATPRGTTVSAASSPGFSVPSGSSAARTRRRTSRAPGSPSSARWWALARPTPCSPDTAPPSAIPAANTPCSVAASCSGSGWNTARCTFPSPAWPQPSTREPWASPTARARPRNAAIAERGTTRSTISSAPAALTAQNAFSRASTSRRADPAGRSNTSAAPSADRMSASSSASSSTRSARRPASSTSRWSASTRSSGRPRVRSAAAQTARMVGPSRYSHTDGASPAPTMRPTAAVTASAAHR